MSISELLPNRSAATMIPDDNNAREIIRYFIDVQKCAKFLGVISFHTQILKPIFFLRAHCNGKRGLFLFAYRKYCYYFPSFSIILVSIVKYNNTIYVQSSLKIYRKNNLFISHMVIC